MNPRELRRFFLTELIGGLAIVWPVLSTVISGIVLGGAVIGRLEGWGLLEGVYFAFVTSLTVGYGDLAPRLAISRVLAIVIGLLGVLLIALLAAVAVRAMEATAARRSRE